MDDCLKLSMWSGPRNVSTALMYAFRQRSDTLVVDEPLYGHYLASVGPGHPGEREVLGDMDRDGERVVREVLLEPCGKPVHFFKNMAHHLVGLDREFLSALTNVFLIRNPKEMLPSLNKQLPNPTIRDTGLAQQIEILDGMVARHERPVVLDAKDLLLDPPGVLRQTCERLQIPFEDAMLHWPAGPKPEDGVWAEHWYENVHASTGFGEYRPKTEPFPKELMPLLEECQPSYERLREHAILAGV